MEKGFFIVARNVFSHWIWTDDEPFCRRAAWIDLIGLANHSDTKLMVRGNVIEAKRGEVNRSVRWLAKRWHWSRGKVERFLSALEADGMLSQKTSHGETVLTLCNYSEWQDSWRKNGPQNGPQTGQRRATDGPLTGHEQRIKKNDKELKRSSYYSDNNNGGEFMDLDDIARGIVPPDMQAKVQRFLEKETN